MSDTAYYILGEMIVTIGIIYRAQTISSRNYLKDEDAFIPIKRKEGEVGIIRGRVPWECAGMLLNGILFIITILIKTKIQGQTDFLYSNIVFLWIMFTGFLVPLWDLGVYIYIRILIKRKKERIKLPESPKDKSILELEKTAEHYASIYDPIDDSNIYVLNAYKPIYCLRDKGDYYRVAYFDEIVNDHQSVILYLFDKNGQKLLYEEVHNPTLGKEAFLELKPGTLVSEVKEMDIRGIYSGFQKSSTDKRSLHITNDWHFIEIHYDYDYRIQEVVCELL